MNKTTIDLEIKIDDIIAVISSIKFKLGERPIFIEIPNIHINEVTEEIINKPFVNKMF